MKSGIYSLYLLLLELARLTPFLLPFLFSLIFIMTLDLVYIYSVGVAVFTSIFNWVLKQIFKKMYQLAGKESLPILGRGYRPVGATDCSLTHQCGKKISKTFGMPSGHSQLVWALTTYFILYLYNIDKEELEDNKHKQYIYGITYGIIVLLALIVSYSRVRMGCHTIQQVILGGIFGGLTGASAYYMYPDIHNQSKKLITYRLTV